MNNLTVIILNYNTKELLKKCLQSVLASQSGYGIETVVSDNGSMDGSNEMVRSEFPQVKLIENKVNLGFSKGNNVAIKQSDSKYILLLNSDTTVESNTFDLSIKYLESHPDVGALGCKVLLPSGELDKAARRNFPNPLNSFLRLFGFKKFSNYNIEGPIDQEMEVDAIMGAYMMVPKSVIDKVGLLDEDFFMYGEDLDWCWRIKEAGYKIIYYPAVQITHHKYGTSKNIAFKMINYAHNAMKIFYRKHYAPNNPGLLNWLVYTGIEVRKILVLLINLFRKNKTVH